MRKIAYALIVCLVAALPAWGRADIARRYRVANEPPGYCCWACLETLCRHQRIRAGYDLLENRKDDPDFVFPSGSVIPKHLGSDSPIRQKLEALGIRYRLNRSYARNEHGIAQIRRAVHQGHGALVGIWHGRPTTDEVHAIIVIDFDEDGYEYIDPNDPGRSYFGTRAYFQQEWTGLVVTVD